LNAADRSIVNISLKHQQKNKIGPFKDITLYERQYNIRPAEGESIPVLMTSNQFLDKGQRFYFPLGSDLPEGQYKLNINLEKGPKGYMLLYRIVPGIFSKRILKKEVNQYSTSNY